MITLSFIILVLIASAIDIYIWASFLRKKALFWQVLHFLPTVGILIFLVLNGFHRPGPLLFQVFNSLILCFFLPKLLFALFSFLRLKRIGVVLALIVGCSTFYGIVFGWKSLAVREQSISDSRLPAEFENFKIVQISDLHLDNFAHCHKFINRIVDSVNAQNADLIVYTGDLVSRQSKEVIPFANILSRLKARYGVLSVLGNHDYAIYGPLRKNPSAMIQDKENLISDERGMGWQVLLNENVIIGDSTASLAVVGVENDGKVGGLHFADLDKAMEGVPPESFTILLSHDPWFWKNKVLGKTSIPLTLSGHTHSGHFRIGSFSIARWMVGPYWGGLYKEGSQQLFVSAGVGGMIRFRLGAWPEINVITLHKD
ncbi:MAG: metallophosphoesterase [Bacteroidales bacterium]|nr:metallophosphoesterase [Bacteroidales bacterium]